MDRGAWQATAHKVTKRWTQLSNLACRKSREREKGPEDISEEIIAENFPEWERKSQPSPVFLPGESHGQRSLESYSPWGRKESDTTE